MPPFCYTSYSRSFTPISHMEGCPSGLRSTIGNRVCDVESYLGFKSLSLRQSTAKAPKRGLFHVLGFPDAGTLPTVFCCSSKAADSRARLHYSHETIREVCPMRAMPFAFDGFSFTRSAMGVDYHLIPQMHVLFFGPIACAWKISPARRARTFRVAIGATSERHCSKCSSSVKMRQKSAAYSCSPKTRLQTNAT